MVKKIVLIISAFLLALILTELFTRYIIGYPPYGLKEKVKIRDIGWSNIWKPYSKYWNVEGGNNVFKRNNLGLPGIDVKISGKSKYIFVLGSSFVEALQVPPSKITTSIFQEKLKQIDPTYQVINLGYSGHDPFDSYRRAKYFSETYNPDKVILLIDKTNNKWFGRHKKPLDFSFNDNSFKRQSGLKAKINFLLRNNSSFINIIINGIKSINKNNKKKDKKNKIIEKDVVPKEMYLTLKEYKKRYKDKFYCISIMNSERTNQNIEEFCLMNNINFDFKTIKTKENMLNGTGHLNEIGNKKTGIFLSQLLMSKESSR